jgi:hypothetical protein
MLRSPHCLDNRLIDGGKVVSLRHRPRYTPQKHNFSASGNHFSSKLSKPQGLERLKELRKLKKIIHLIGPQTRTFRLVVQCLNHYATACTLPTLNISGNCNTINNTTFPNILTKTVMGSATLKNKELFKFI